ncbi:MAG: 16S rRNA (cytidine(1402)-2'-O)-methyltransferase [Pseudomonadota bacterium]
MSDKTPETLEPALYVVATPIGNLGDLSPRAREVLASVDRVYAEDTRHSQQMFRRVGVAVRVRSLHQHNERARADEVAGLVADGGAVALVSDAGTPVISDPGGRLVDHFHGLGLAVRAVPGPSAVVAALSVSGLSAEGFRFGGFLPAKAGARDRALADVAAVADTLVYYEAPHRVLATLQAMRAQFGGARRATLVRELTKRFETTRRASLEVLCDWVQRDPDQQRGEIVLVVEGCAVGGRADAHAAVNVDAVLRALSGALPPRQAASLAAQVLGGEKNHWYREILARKP